MINSPEPDQLPAAPMPAPSDRELELLRQHSIRVLGSVAAALEAAAAQRQKLLVDVQTAEQTLEELANERELAGARLAATRAQLEDAAIQLELVQLQRNELVRVATQPQVRAAEGADIRVLKRILRPAHLGFSQIATGGLIALLLGLAVLLTPLTQVFGGLQLLAVMSGSMEPTIPVGGVVAIRPVSPSDLKVGDAITFVNLSNPDVLVTHRIVSLEMRDGQTMLTTKGDANNAVDALTAPATRAVGRVEFALPYLGYAMVWLGTPLAKIAIVGLAVLGLVLTSVQRSSGPSAPTPVPAASDTYAEHEREIQSLLGQ